MRNGHRLPFAIVKSRIDKLRAVLPRVNFQILFPTGTHCVLEQKSAGKRQNKPIKIAKLVLFIRFFVIFVIHSGAKNKYFLSPIQTKSKELHSMLLQLAFGFNSHYYRCPYRWYRIRRVRRSRTRYTHLWIRAPAHFPSYRCHAYDRCRNSGG